MLLESNLEIFMKPKGSEKTGGRTAGTPNKFSKTVKDAFLEVFDGLGGPEGFLKWAQKSDSNQKVFYSAFAKMLPKEIHVANSDSPDSLPFRLLVESEEKHDSNS